MSPGFRRHALTAFVCLSTLYSAPVFAQDSFASASQSNRPQPSPGTTADFMFGRPRGSVSLRGSWVFSRAGSDLFDFVSDQLTVEKRDFNMPAISAEAGVAITPRLEVLASLDVGQSKTASEYRAFVDNNNQPIAQETTLKTANIGGSIKYALTPRGHSISRLAWIPRTVSPYVGAGAGAMYYRFNQVGDFVDFVDSSVFHDDFASTGWAPSAHVFGGSDIQLHRMIFLQVEGRYRWAKAELGADFLDFDPIDLSGFVMTTGISVLF